MTPDTTELRRLLEASTPGEWRADTEIGEISTYRNSVCDLVYSDDDARFIVAAHNHLGPLLDGYERMREALREAQSYLRHQHGMSLNAIDELLTPTEANDERGNH